ncbi:MAG: hypothetical protein QW172_06125 [Candidatus Bathyarchaeia archaeon]
MFLELMYESERFKWYGDRATINGDIEQFYSYMEHCYSKAKGFLGFEPEGYLKIPVYIRPSSECRSGIGGATTEGKLQYCAGRWADNKWCRRLLPHELVNVFTGYLSAGWPWADGSELWYGRSPFPYFVSVEIMRSLGYVSEAEHSLAELPPRDRVFMFQEYLHRFSWDAYRRFFSQFRRSKEDLTVLHEPEKTHRVFAYMIYGSGLTDLNPLINLFEKYGFNVDVDLLKQQII